jgi:diguanylate cyclase (GGDEF)-like protein/PAS domain S-box-containing protein
VETLEQFQRRSLRAKGWSEEARRLAMAGHERNAQAAERLAHLADDEGSPQSAAEHRNTAAGHRVALRRLAMAGHEQGAQAAERLACLADDEGSRQSAAGYRSTAAHLRAEARRLSGVRVFDSAREASVAMDAGGFITDWGPRAEALFGWHCDQAVGRVLADTIIPERYRKAHLEGLRRFLETGEGPALGRRLEMSALHRDGYEFPIELTITAEESDGRHSFFASVHDLSRQLLTDRYLKAQNEVSRLFGTCESLSEAIPQLLAVIGDAMDWRVGGYWSEEEPGVLRCRATWRSDVADPFERVTQNLLLAVGEGLPGRVWQTGEPVWIEDAGREPNFPRAEAAAKAGLRSAICLPVRKRDELVGAVEFLSDAIQHPEPILVQMMTMLSVQIGQLVSVLDERSTLLHRLEALTRTDELTGLGNRRAWKEDFERQLARCRQERKPLCVALLDLDHFNVFNDRRGRAAGDAILSEIAANWREQLGMADVLVRYGGGQFALALPARPMDAATAAVEQLRAGIPSEVTCSGGLVMWDGQESHQQLLARAEAALERAKREGRDRTVVDFEDANC